MPTAIFSLPLVISVLCVSVASAQQTTPPSTPQPPTPQQIPAQQTPAQRTPAQQTPTQQTTTQATGQQSTAGISSPSLNPTTLSVPVFVNDFELSVSPTATAALPASGASGTTATNRAAASGPTIGAAQGTPPVQTDSGTTTSAAPPKPASVLSETDPPSQQARHMIDFFNLTLVQTFRKNHFTAARVSGAPPNSGALISGIFAEADPQNRVRRGLLGSTAPGSKFILYVGVANLARPRQPLYQPAPVQDQDARYGPVITLNNYISLTKFEVDKNPTEEEVRKICAEIVGNLAALLAVNPGDFSH